MKKINEKWKLVATLVIPSILTCLIFSVLVPRAQPLMLQGQKNNNKQLTSVQFTAIGDSLTEGVGDTTNSGGFVPYLKQDLLDASDLEEVKADNFGKKGDTVTKVIDKIEENNDVQTKLKKADFITLTVGGNDLIGAITKEFTKKIKKDSFDSYRKSYETNLNHLYEVIRKYNNEAPIYQMGIYNPVQLSFANISEFSEIVSDWDKQTEDVIEQQKNVYFVSINDLLSNGLDTSEESHSSEVEETDPSTDNSGANNLISDLDNFHPNNLGYQLIANAFKEKILETSKDWGL